MIITSRWNCIKIILKEVRRPVWWKLNQTRIGCHREEKVIYISGRFSASVGSLVCPSLFATQRNKHPRFFHPPEIMEETRKRKSSRLWPFCLLVSGSSDGTTTVVEWQIDCCSQCLVGLSWFGWEGQGRESSAEKKCAASSKRIARWWSAFPRDWRVVDVGPMNAVSQVEWIVSNIPMLTCCVLL